MRCRLMLAAASLLSIVSLAPAQVFAPRPIDPTPIGAVAPAPLPPSISPIVPASARSVAPAGCSSCGGPVVAYGDGCAAPGASLHRAHERNRSSVFGRFLIGAGTINPVSCGCLASERTFAFGSCRQFYNPQLDCFAGAYARFGSHYGQGGGGGCGDGGCWPVDRRPPGYGVTSYLNR